MAALGPNLLAGSSSHDQAVWLLTLDNNGEVVSEAYFNTGGSGGMPVGGFPLATVPNGTLFGASLEWINPGLLAVGAPGDDTGGSNRGAVWMVPVNPASATLPVIGTPTRIANGSAGLALANTVGFGSSLSFLPNGGKFPGRGTGGGFLAVGAPNRVTGQQAGAIWIVGVNGGGGATSAVRALSPHEGVSNAVAGKFGSSAAWLGDADNDPSTIELAVGAPQDRGRVNAALQLGLVHVLSFSDVATGTVARSGFFGGRGGEGGFPAGLLDQGDNFGASLASLGDLDGDGHSELAIGAWSDDDGGSAAGAVWIVSIDPCSLTCSGLQGKASDLTADFDTGFGGLDAADYLGVSMAPLGSPNGSATLAVGAPQDDDQPTNSGAVWIIDLGDGGN